MTRLRLPIAAAALAWATAPAPAHASSRVIVRAPEAASFEVDRHGRATVKLHPPRQAAPRRRLGRDQRNPAPTCPDSPQQRFRLDYSGGWGSFGAGY